MLASSFQREGFGVFRFDYYGSGDSFGEDADAGLEGWTQDLELAVEEAQSLAGKNRTILIGLRLGAHVAGRVATRSPNQVSKVVFWEPTLSGSEFNRDWTGRSAAPESDMLVDGFLLPREFAREIEGLNLLDMAGLGSKVTLAQSVKKGEPAHQGLPDSWRILRVAGPQNWKEIRGLGAGAIPVDLITEIVACLS
jgi:pimeloyl-ACP methyl ester carboxylesterase